MQFVTISLRYFSFLFIFTIFLRSEEDVLILASPHWDGIQKEFTQAFQSHYLQSTGRPVQLRWRDIGGTSQIEKAVNALYSKNPGSCGIDIFWGGGLDPYENQKNRGQLESYFPAPEILNAFPPHVNGVPLRDPEGTYYATALSTFGIFENREIARLRGLPEVRTWADLARPEFNGWISMVDPRKSGSAHMIYEMILQAHGWDTGWRILMAMSANARIFSQSGSTATKEVSWGEVSHAVAIDLYALAIQSVMGSGRVRFIFPSEHSIVVPDGIGIFKGAPHPEAARRFIDFVLSSAGQNLWVKKVGETGGPVRHGIGRISILPSLQKESSVLQQIGGNLFDHPPAFLYDSKLASNRWIALNELMGRTLIDLHPDLQKSWTHLQSLPPEKEHLARELFLEPLVSESEVSESGPQWKSNRLQAERQGDLWMRKAKERYRVVLQKSSLPR